MKNTIKVSITKGYEIYPDYFNYKIDNELLTEKLDALYPNLDLKDFVPTLLNWIVSRSEKLEVWGNIFPEENETTICPVLMCPEDCDLSSTTVVAEITNKGDVIEWKRLGLDKSKNNTTSEIDWFHMEELSFKKGDYLEMVEVFNNSVVI